MPFDVAEWVFALVSVYQVQLYGAWALAELCKHTAGHTQLFEAGAVEALLSLATVLPPNSLQTAHAIILRISTFAMPCVPTSLYG